MTLTPSRFERVVGMFARGYSLDMISEWGITGGGWTRDEAKSVVAAKGWALDWSGRLQQRYMSQAKIEKVPLKNTAQSAAEADLERMLTVGTDHELVEIRRLAVKAQRALDELRRALIIQEEKDAQAVVEYRRRLKDPARINHGSWGGYLTHKMNKIPTTPECGCEAARAAYVARSGNQYDRVG